MTDDLHSGKLFVSRLSATVKIVYFGSVSLLSLLQIAKYL